MAPERLRASEDIAAVFRDGRRRAGRFAVCHVRPREAGPVRVAVVASRKVGKAVARNRAKRLLREAARATAWHPGLDVVLVARASSADAPAGQVIAEVNALAEQLDAAPPTLADAS